MDYPKMINEIITNNISNLDIIYNKLCEIETNENNPHELFNFFFEQTCYYYNSTTNLYIEYSDNYKFINENNMLHIILKFISKYQDIYLLTSSNKQIIKTKIQKKIKERTIYDNIPESITIQNTLSFLHPNIFIDRNIAKYFMVTLGDIILKKTDMYFFIPVHIKPLITLINKYLSMYFYTICLGNYYKYKYTDHDVNKSRVIPFNNININHYNLDSTLIVNIICISIHYSNRYDNGDKFISMNEIIRPTVCWINNTKKEDLIDSFIKDFLYTKNGYKITEKDMLFLWKSYIKKNNIINIFTKHSDILPYVACIIEYNNTFINITSLYLPYVQNFKDFWSKYIYIDENNFEINELLMLFTEEYNIKNIDENNIYDLIHYYFPEVKIQDKYIQNIGCTLWNKKKDVLTFLANHPTIYKNELYGLYCAEYKDKKRVNKHYFMSFI
jgi:hypothetical protein